VYEKPYADTTTPLKLKPGALNALRRLKLAGHVLVLWSGRSNRALMYDPEFDPLVRAGLRPNIWYDGSRELHADRWREMLAFVEKEMAGIFDAIDDGRCGKLEADHYIDDRAIAFGETTWLQIVDLYGA
jgi:hypothetical protein